MNVDTLEAGSSDPFLLDLQAWKQSPRVTFPGIRHLDQNIQDDIESHLGAPKFGDFVSFTQTIKTASNKTEAAAAYLRNEVKTNSHEWLRMCLKLQRTARGIPAVYPTALSAAQAVPKSERVYNLDKWKRGMVGFSYDPTIPGTAGHVFFICGRNNDGEIITLSNDVKEPGAVDYVPLSFYRVRWNQKIQFAATNLNGYDFSDFNETPVQRTEGSLGQHYFEMLKDLKKIRERKREKYGSNAPVVLALNSDIERMTKTYDRFKVVS